MDLAALPSSRQREQVEQIKTQSVALLSSPDQRSGTL